MSNLFRNPFEKLEKVDLENVKSVLLSKKIDQLIDFEKAEAAIQSRSKLSFNGIHEAVFQIDWSSFLGDKYLGLDYFDCPLFPLEKGRRGWFYTDKSGVTRYHTSKMESKHGHLSFDIVTLFAIKEGHSKSEMIRELERRFSIGKGLDVENEEKRLSSFFDLVSTQLKLRQSKSDNMLKYAYLTINNYAKDQAKYRKKDPVTGDFYFTVSLNRLSLLSEQLAGRKISKSVLSQMLSTLTFFGVLSHYEPVGDQERLIIEKSKKKGRNQIQYYQLGLMPITLVCDKISEFYNKQLTPYDMDSSTISRLFGKEEALRVFPYIKEQNVKKSALTFEKNNYFKVFALKMKEKGFVTKSEMKGIVSDSLGTKLWTIAAKLFVGTVKRLGKKLIKQLNLSSDEKGAVLLAKGNKDPLVTQIIKKGVSLFGKVWKKVWKKNDGGKESEANNEETLEKESGSGGLGYDIGNGWGLDAIYELF